MSLLLLFFFIAGLLIPEPTMIPVANATNNDWNTETFWYEPWGASGVHKGVDIFAKHGTDVIAATNQLILYRGEISQGGNVVIALGPKWRIHYYAHLAEITDGSGIFIKAGTKFATVGDSGNAKGKAPHLHYSLLSLIPLPWLIDQSTQGYSKAFYLNPIEYITTE